MTKWFALGVAIAAACILAVAQAPRSRPLTRGAGMTDSAVCADCHGAIAATYSKTPMAQAFGRVGADTPQDVFPVGEFRHDASEQAFRMFWRNGRPFLSRSLTGPDGAPSEVFETEVHYWLGSGSHARSFIHRTPGGKLIILPLTWYASGGGYWGMNPNYDRPVHSGFGRVLDYRCVSCHIGNPELEEGADLIGTGWKYPSDIPEGVDCQRCHGPGQAHVAAARAGRPLDELRAAVVNPARLSPERQIDVCMQCHLETTSSPLPGHMVKFDRGVFSYLPGEPLADWALYFDYEPESVQHQKFDFVSAAYRFRESRCFLESKGALTCTTCHDAHDMGAKEDSQQRYTEACLSCHQSSLDTLVEAKRHTAASNCTTCHMPERRASDAPELRVADHRIPRTPPDEAPLEAGMPAYRGKVVPYLPAGPPSTPESELYTAVAQVTQDANLAEGTVLLDEAIKRYSPDEGEFYLAAGEAWRKLGRLDRGGPLLEEAVRRMPGDWRPQYSLAMALASAGRFAQSVQLLRSASLLAPDEPGPQIELASVLMEQGQTSRALAVGRTATRVDSTYAESHNALGAVLLQSGDAAGATAALREAVRLRPELPPLRTDLATVLALTGQATESNHHFERALRLDPSFAEGHAAYADSLTAQGKLAQAREHFETALKLDPNQPEARGKLAGVLVQLGQPVAAVEQLREAVRITPDYYDAHFALGQMLLSAGERDQAITHLRRATESPDPELRQAVEEVLSRVR